MRRAEEALDEALEQAIEYRILYREALLAGFELPEDAVENRIAEIKKQYESTEDFEQMLEEAGETMSEFRERIRMQILAVSMSMHKRRELEDQAVVSEGEVRQYYKDHQDEFTHPERVRVRRIFLPAEDEEDARAAARARIDALKEELAMGADFAELARAHSQGPEAEDGGSIGWVRRGDLVPALEEAVFALDPGETSDAVETEWGVHLLLVEEKDAAGATPFEEARTEIESILRAQNTQEQFRKWMAGLRKRSRVRVFR